MAGISVESGIRKKDDGYQLRFYDGKVKKRKWSNWTFFPRLPKKFRKTCVVFRLEALLDLTRDLQIEKLLFAGALETPLFVSGKPKSSGISYAIKENTIATKAKKEFLDNFLYPEEPASKVFGAHSFRHAHASALFDSGVSLKNIALHQQTSSESVEKTYVMQVRRDWIIPQKCVDNVTHIGHKLLVPYAHYKSTKSGQECTCSNFADVIAT